jgi:hypothetical protein
MGKRATEFQTIRSEGGLLPPDLLRRVVDPTGKVPGVEPSAYGLPAGERLNEAITQSWNRLRRHWAEFRTAVPPSSLVPSSSSPVPRPSSDAFTGLTNDKWSLPLLRELGFGFLATTAGPTIDGKTYAISRFAGNTAIHLVGCGVSLDRRAAGVRGAAAGNPHGLVQEFLNRSPGHLWAIVSNGLAFRILRDNQALSRQSFLEFDLEAMFDGEVYSDFVLLWLMAHATRFLPRQRTRDEGRGTRDAVNTGDEGRGTSGVETCWLEVWSKEAAEQGVAALTDLRGGVEKALEILGQGFVSHPKNTALRDALRKGDVKLSDFHHQLLRVVYRLIFLFVAEDRELEGIPILHPRERGTGDEGRVNARGDDSPPSSLPPRPSALATARERYAAHYSTSRLRELASRIKGSRHGDLWRQFQLLVGALSGDERFATMREALALPSLGSMLWNPASTSLLNGPGLAEFSSPVPHPSSDGSRPSSLVSGPSSLVPSTPSPVPRPSDGTELANVDFLEALRHLAFIRKDKILRPVDYKNLGSEEFGGVYESFLALTPQISSDGARFTFAEFAGNERKTSGSYYTPDSLVQCLLDSALDPVVNERLADAERLAKADWPTVEKEIQSDPAKRTYVLAFLTKHAGASKTATAEERKRAWDSIPPTPRRWKLSEEAILAIKVCDKACGSGHFLVGAGHRLARHLARVRALAQGESEPSPLLYQTALRDVIGHCLYGVDINPMAVELCKVTLWLEAMEPGKPLSFLDHHIRCGNSLLGATPELISAGLPDETFIAIEGDDKEACSSLKKLNKAQREGLRHLFIAEDTAIRERMHLAAAAIDEISDNRPEDIHRKEAAFRNAQQNYDFQKAWDLANLWCAAFVIKKHFPGGASEISNLQSQVAPPSGPTATQAGLFGGTEEGPKAKGKKTKPSSRAGSETPIGITTQHLRDFVESGALPDGLLAEVKRLADQYQFFHFHLAFPEVFAQGGFDVILGNPPWERVNLEARQFFATTRPDIAEAMTSKRRDLLKELESTHPELMREFQEAQRRAASEIAFFQGSGAYPHLNQARLNTYVLFTELSAKLCNVAGRCGIIVPSGVATDDISKNLFSFLIAEGRLVSLFDFENRDALFPGVHRSYKFCLLTLRGKSQPEPARLSFFLNQPAQLREADRTFSLTADELQLLSPLTGLCPTFRCKADREIVLPLYRRVKPLVKQQEEILDWSQSDFLIMFRSDDSTHLYRTPAELGVAEPDASSFPRLMAGQTAYVPVWESKFLHQFDHRFATFAGVDESERKKGNCHELASAEKAAAWIALPRYWSPLKAVNEILASRDWRRSWTLGYRDITNATNERTAIASCLPEGGAAQPLNLFLPESGLHGIFWLASMNSMVLDYVARQRIGGVHLNITTCRQLPVLGPASVSSEMKQFVRDRVLELVFTSPALEAFAQDCSWSGPPFRWDEERRFLLRCELDAAFVHLYLGPETEWRQQPAALIQAFPTPRAAVSYILDTFPIVKRKDEAKFNGDYRTKRVILEIYDALATAMQTGKAYQTRLNPAPASLAVAHLPRFDRERFNFKEAGDYILPFVASLLRHQGGECDVMILIRAYAMLLDDRKTLTALTEARLGAEAGAWVKGFNQPVDELWFLPILRGLDNRDVIKLEERGENDVFVRLLDASVPSNSTVETDVYLLLQVLDLNAAPPAAVAEQVKRISPKAVRTSLHEAKLVTA